MLPGADNITIFLGAMTLALLSIYTIERCRADNFRKFSTDKEFLFLGTRRLHSLASTLGAIFSVTYFFGATFIYGHLFKGLLLVIAGLMFSLLAFLIPWVVSIAHRSLDEDQLSLQHSNLLLDLFRQRLSEGDFRLVLRLYVLVYFGLFVEELAVSRLVLATLFPFHPAVTTILLATTCFVILAYLYFGGFRAVLISDYEQLRILLAFTAMLLFLIYRDSPGHSLANIFALPAKINPLGAFFALIFGVSWFSASVDFFSRLNFSVQPDEDLLMARKALARASLLVLFIIIFIGVLFGGHLAMIFPVVESPSGYTEAAISYFLFKGSRVTAIAFFVGLFCMMFTTLNTLLLTLLQVSSYQARTVFKRENLVTIMLVAIIASCAIRFDWVSAFGVFVGSLMILPFVGLLHVLAPARFQARRGGLKYLGWSLWTSVLAFVVLFKRLELDFARHFLIPGIVVVSTASCLLLSTILDRLNRRFQDVQ